MKRLSLCILSVCASWTAAAEPVWLSDLPIVPNRESENLQQALFRDKDFNHQPIEIGGRKHAKGLTIIRGSGSWSHRLDGQYVGLYAEAGQWEGNAVFRFFGDGKLLHDTGVLPLRATTPVLIDVRGVQELQITSLDTISPIRWNTKAVLASPRLTRRVEPKAAPGPGPKPGNRPPEAVIRADPEEGAAPLTVRFRGSDSKDADGAVGRYTWYFGDGVVETLAPDPTHVYEEPGLYEVVLAVQDDAGGVGVARRLIAVRPPLNFPPRPVIAVSKRTAPRGAPVRFDASGSGDPDGRIADYAWDFGPAGSASGAVVEKAFPEAGRFTATLTVRDNAGASASRSISIRVTDPNAAARPFPLRQNARVLFIGNSLIGFCGPLSGWMEILDKNSPAPLGLRSADIGKGMGTLEDYATWTRLGIKEKIDEGWDIVVIQPWEDAYLDKVSDEDLLKHARTLVEWVRATGAFPVFYEPQVGWLKYDEWQERGHRRIRRLAETLDTGFIPAGQVWSQARERFPLPMDPSGIGAKTDDPMTLNRVLYGDFGHQSFTGAALNGLMVWRYLTGASARAFTFSPETPHLDKEKREKIEFQHLPYLQELVDRAIVPGAERLR